MENRGYDVCIWIKSLLPVEKIVRDITPPHNLSGNNSNNLKWWFGKLIEYWIANNIMIKHIR